MGKSHRDFAAAARDLPSAIPSHDPWVCRSQISSPLLETRTTLDQRATVLPIPE